MEDTQKRLLLALVLAGAVTVLWQLVFAPSFRPPAPTAGEGSGTGAAAATEAPSEAGTGQAAPAAAEEPGEIPDVTNVEPPAVVVETDVLPPQLLQGERFQAYFSNVGGNLARVQIQEPQQYIPRDDFGGVFPEEEASAHLPLGVTISGIPSLLEDSLFELVPHDAPVTDDRPHSQVAVDDQGQPYSRDDGEPIYARLVYRWSDGRVEVDKVYTVNSELAYITDFDLIIRDLAGRGQRFDGLEVHVWADDEGRQGRGIFNPIANQIQAACYVNDDIENESRDDILDEGGYQFPGSTLWAGVEDRYFLTAVVLPEGESAAGCRFGAEAEDNYLASALRFGELVVDPGGERRLSFKLFTGPKDQTALTAAGSRLSRSVNYGLFGFLARPLKWLLRFFHGFVPNWGVAIILLTVFVKLLLFPLNQKSYRSMERMREVQPKLTELREKYKNDRTKLTEETMKLYREHNVNPFGCLPMLLQIPIYIALYRTIYSSVELYKADFALWITDLSRADPYYILPVLMAVTMFGQQLLMPSQVDNPQMKWTMRLMPIMFGFFMLVLPSGLVLYIFASSLLGIIQQWLIRRQSAKAREEKEEAVPEPKTLTRQQRRRRARRQRSS